MTAAEAAEALSVPETWLRKRASAGVVPCTRLGRNLRFTDEQVRQIIASAESPVIGLPRSGLTRRARRAS